MSTKQKLFHNMLEPEIDYARNINMYLDTFRQKVFEAKRRLIELDIEVTPQAIKDVMLGKSVNKEKHMLIELFKRQNDQIKALVGKDYAQGTYQIFNRTLLHTIEFLNHYGKLMHIDINEARL